MKYNILKPDGFISRFFLNKLPKTEKVNNIYYMCKYDFNIPKSVYIGSGKKLRVFEYKKIIKDNNIDFAVIFNEDYCNGGAVEYHRDKLNLPTVGVTSQWFQLEADKLYCKSFMNRHNIKTPVFRIINNKKEINDVINEFGFPIVIKNNYLQAGFGSFICNDKKEAEKRVKSILKSAKFCFAEKFVKGFEITVHYIWDERSLIELNPVKDYKKSEEGNNGINTGGMGCYTPVKMTEKQKQMLDEYTIHLREIFEKIKPEFTGIFAVNLLFTDNELYTLEFNMRPGETEFETLVENMETDIFELFYNIAHHKAIETNIVYKKGITGCVNVCHKDYLDITKHTKRKINFSSVIQNQDKDIEIFWDCFPDSNKQDTDYRLFYVLSTSETNPFKKIYEYLDKVKNKDFYYRKDIGS